MSRSVLALRDGDLLRAMGACQMEIMGAGQKLVAFGHLLESQDVQHEGFVELHGLGIALRELGEDLLEVWGALDALMVRNQ